MPMHDCFVYLTKPSSSRACAPCTTNVDVGPVVEAAAGHIQVLAARVLVLNDVLATGVETHVVMVMGLVVVVSAPATAGRADEPLRRGCPWVVPLVNIRS